MGNNELICKINGETIYACKETNIDLKLIAFALQLLLYLRAFSWCQGYIIPGQIVSK